MQIYIRGQLLAPQNQTGLSKYALKKYYPVDAEGNPTGQPFLLRSHIEIYHRATGTPCQIISNPVGKPRRWEPGEYDRQRDQKPERKAYHAQLARARRSACRNDTA